MKDRDLLFKFPTFNYFSMTSSKITDSIKGLLVLYSILNWKVKDYQKKFLEAQPDLYTPFEKCGWAKALMESNASYKRELLIEKPGTTSERSPSPITHATDKDDSAQKAEDILRQHFKKRKVSDK